MSEDKERMWKRISEYLAEYEAGQVGLDMLSEAVRGIPGAMSPVDPSVIDQANDFAAELSRHHDLRNSPWNTPDDVGPEDEQELHSLLDALRSWIDRSLAFESRSS
ncbi:hypothetical protein AB0K09_00800 [Streptomyces sp. NPDC049577]|uniref:hypothetical protein n=1 Tax=Streptomyces sp. NPDC049577 TaxID=3155153 RepID=UPI003425E543